MTLIKKLIFTPFFFISLSLLLYLLNPLFKSYDFIFAFSVSTVIQLIILASLIPLTSLFFVLLAVFVYDWKLILIIGILGSSLPMFFLNQSIGLILSVGILATLLIVYLGLENTLKTYLNFSPAALFSPHIRRFATFLMLGISLTYFLSVSKIIQENGFQIPDSLIEQALKITSPSQEPDQKQTSPLPSITPQQIELLKQNPDLLKQYGLDPSVLDAVKNQLEGIIKPYLGIIPAVLTVLFFFVLQSLVAFINLLIYPILWGMFFCLEKTGFIKFTVEQRPVKKMVV